MIPITSASVPGFIQNPLVPATETGVSVDVVDAADVPQELASQIRQLKPLPIPVATYASMQVTDNMLHIAEESGGNITTHTKALQSQDAAHETISWLEHASLENDQQYIAMAFQQEDQFKELAAKLWLQEDIVPEMVGKQNPACQAPLEALLREVASKFDCNNIAPIELSADREVQVAELVTLEDYRKTTSQADFDRLLKLARAFHGKRLIFISATPRGGGVALMRHAIIRLLRLLHVDAHWHVLIPKSDVFDITKAKFHNVLQAVASPDTVLTEEDKAVYESWTQENAVLLDQAFRQANVVVIDDPQPAGLIPYIRQANPDAKIIYRSHIQIVGSLASQLGTPQYTTWSFLWDRIRLADCFVSHPMKMFIPANVPDEKIFYMPATTDQLDGLNKPLTGAQMSRYMRLFNHLLVQEGQKPLDEERPYIIQVARFDPSKGIPHLLDAYRKLRGLLEKQGKVIPQLVITGNCSIDDPDATRICDETWQILRSDDYAAFMDDVKVLRLPHRDQILNTLLRKSAIALQLSIREGFEVKVTEALMKGKPVIACNVGGIPLQIQDGVNGYLIEVGATTQVAQRLYELLTDSVGYQHMSEAATAYADKDCLTTSNAICWLYLAVQLLNGAKMEGHHQWVKALAQEDFGSEQTISTQVVSLGD
ncbi:MAG TPA: glycosyltransferase [Ktedonobacteraceae bacterium]